MLRAAEAPGPRAVSATGRRVAAPPLRGPAPPIALSQIPYRPVTRFAPSPTGYLHLGHVANAVWTWGIAQATGAKVLLRFEDHDRGRPRPEFERAIVEDLEWLGLVPRGARWVRQSDHDRAYGRAVIHLGRQSPV